MLVKVLFPVGMNLYYCESKDKEKTLNYQWLMRFFSFSVFEEQTFAFQGIFYVFTYEKRDVFSWEDFFEKEELFFEKGKNFFLSSYGEM